MRKIENVLFLCTGNSCRSVFAEYFARWLKETKYKEELKDVEFDSAGIVHFFDEPREGTVKYLTSKGINVDGFIAKKITEDMVNKQDLILGFEARYHTRKLKRKFKNIDDLDKKLFLLLDFAGEKENLEIEDPISLPYDEYKKVLQRIEEGVIKSIKKIIKINNIEES